MIKNPYFTLNYDLFGIFKGFKFPWYKKILLCIFCNSKSKAILKFFLFMLSSCTLIQWNRSLFWYVFLLRYILCCHPCLKTGLEANCKLLKVYLLFLSSCWKYTSYILLFFVFLRKEYHLRVVCYAMEYVVILVKIFGLEANYKLILVYFILFCAPYGHKVDNSFIPVTRDCKWRKFLIF